MSLERLNEVDFVDLYLGPDYCDIKRAAPGELFRRAPLPESHQDLIPELRERCRVEHAKRDYPDFAMRIGERPAQIIYRVTAISDANREPVYVMRKSSASLRRLSELGLPPHVLQALMTQHLTGLVIVAGETASGKTSTISTVVDERLRAYGGIGLTIEQPIEIPLEGLHGEGRCIQHEIDQEENGYAEALRRALRANPNLIMLGEVRHPNAAVEAVMAGMNGHLILTTLHANSVENAIERFVGLVAMGLKFDASNDARQLVASSLALVLHQHLMPTSQAPRLISHALSLQDERQGTAIRSKIRDGRISALNQEIDQQKQQASFSPAKRAG